MANSNPGKGEGGYLKEGKLSVTIMTGKLLWFLLVPILVVFWLISPNAIWEYLFLLRLPLLMAAFLLLLPKLAKDWLPAMLKNLFVLRNKWQLASVVVGAIAAGLAVVLDAAIILNNAPARFDLPRWAAVFGLPQVGNLPEYWQYIIAVILSLYICVTAYDLSGENPTKFPKRSRLQGVLIGGSLSAGLLFLVSVTRTRLAADVPLKGALLQLVSILGKEGTAGYIDPRSRELASDHLAMLAFLLIGTVVYLAIGRFYRPEKKSYRSEAPALLFLLLIVTIATVLYGGATFYFDYFRVPVLFLFLVFSALTYLAFGVNHYFHLADFPEESRDRRLMDGEADDFEQILEKRLQHQASERTLVVVCASGGGIQAAGWTAQVLIGLQDVLGASFTKSVGLISSVSGGSVGAMYYLDCFNEDKQVLEPNDSRHIFNSATKDSLDAVGWGLAYLDLWRFIGLPFLVPPTDDRGTTVEVDWQGEMKHPKVIKTLATWRKQILNGEIPIPVFNATLVENGERFLITPVTFGKIPQKKFVDFNSLYGKLGYDMSVVTAARLSATFPYVSPICQNDRGIPGKNFHVADGGYFDNSGFVTATEWLDQLLSRSQQPLGIKRVMILQLNAFPEAPSTEAVQGSQGWFMATIGPLLAMFKVRDPVLASRNATEAALLKDRWKGQVDIQYFPIFFPSSDEVLEKLELFNDKGQYRPPLSWRLTDGEKLAIQEAWKAIAKEGTSIKSAKVIQNIRKQWHETWKMPKA